MSDTEKTEAATEDLDNDSTVQTEEKTYSKAELTGILSRKEKKWAKDLEDIRNEYQALKTDYDAKVGKELSAEDKLLKMQDEFKRTIDKERKEKEQLLTMHTNSKIESELMKATSKTTRPELVAQLLRAKVKFDRDSNSVHGIGEFDSPVSLDEMVNGFMKEYPEFAPSPKGGSGAVGNRSQVVNSATSEKPPKDRHELLERVKAKAKSGEF